MRIYQKLSITILGLVLISLSITEFLFFYNSSKNLKKNIFSKLETVTDLKVAKLKDFFKDRENDINIFSGLYLVKIAIPNLDKFKDDWKNPSYIEARKLIDEQLSNIREAYQYNAIALLNQEGTVIYSLGNEDLLMGIGSPLEDLKVFEKDRTGVYISDIFRLKSSPHKYGIFISAPVYDSEHKFIGVFVAGLDMCPVFDFVQDATGLGETGETFLVKKIEEESKGASVRGADKNKEYILFLNSLHYDPDAALNKKAYFGEATAIPSQMALGGKRGSGVAVDYRGKKVIAAWRKVPILNWGLVTKIDLEEALEPIAALKKIFYSIFLSAVFLAAIVTSFIARSFSRPIYNLQVAIESVAKGNLDYKVGTDAKDEIGELSRSFDKMVLDLKKSTTSIENLNSEIAVRKALEEELHNLAIYDDLTKLLNRRGFFTLAEQQLAIANRYKISMHLFYVDMDNLKTINDSLGHAEGDKALVKIATVLKKVYRGSDIIGRIGGDEFAVLTIKTKDSDIPLIVKRLNEIIDNLNVDNPPFSPRLSVTVGSVYCDPENRCLLQEFLDQADRVMYSNKRKQA